VDPTEVAIDEGVVRFRAVLRAHGQAEVSFGVVVPRARLEVGVLVVARGWRSMTTRSTTQRVAAGLLAGGLAQRPSEAEILQAIEDAQLRTEIEALPHGLDTTLGETRLGLLGGQQQRVVLARLLLRSQESSCSMKRLRPWTTQ
jgi:ABC-type protease/lipase transport system fused ATPase/permease subunit